MRKPLEIPELTAAEGKPWTGVAPLQRLFREFRAACETGMKSGQAGPKSTACGRYTGVFRPFWPPQPHFSIRVHGIRGRAAATDT